MHTAALPRIHSPDFQQLLHLFNSFQVPYGQGDIIRFNLAYQRSYPCLTASERRQADDIVDELIASSESEELVCRLSES